MSESGNLYSEVIGRPTGVGAKPEPTFDTDQVVDWTCPCCGQNGYDDRRSRESLPVCTNTDCAVKMFSVFRGEPDE